MLYNFIEYIKEKTGYAYLNKILLFSALFLILFGFLSFFSASIGFLNKASSEDFFVNFVRMQVIAYIIGFILMLIFYFLNEKFLNRAAPYFFAFSILIGLITFIPGISLAHGGGVRWINIFGFSFQPADIIKFSSFLFSIRK